MRPPYDFKRSLRDDDEHSDEHSTLVATPAAQRRSVGEGLLRLDEATTNVAGGDLVTAQAARRTEPEVTAHVTPGASLNRLIAQVAAQQTAIELTQEQPLRRRAEELRVGAHVPDYDVSFYTNVRLMNVISHAIEEQVITRGLSCEVYAGFQRLALLKPQVTRYRALLQVARHVLVYGIDDIVHGSPVAALKHPRLLRMAITLPSTTQLEWFWFVVVDTPQLSTALVAQQTAGDVWAPTQMARTYRGFWTFDARLVRSIVELLRQGAQMLYPPVG